MRFLFHDDILRTSFLPPVWQDVPDLRRRIITAISEIDRGMLQRVWAEMDYRLDVCLVTKGRHVEQLWGMQKKKLRKFLFPSVVRMLQSFPPFKCTDFMNCVGELWKTGTYQRRKPDLKSRFRQHSVKWYCDMMLYVGGGSKKGVYLQYWPNGHAMLAVIKLQPCKFLGAVGKMLKAAVCLPACLSVRME
jgi:hypothetical protein